MLVRARVLMGIVLQILAARGFAALYVMMKVRAARRVFNHSSNARVSHHQIV